jgi:hypothetical protein
MTNEARAKHIKRLRRLRRAARRWSVQAGVLVGATAVLTPYGGLGIWDAVWAAAAGGSVAMTAWRWKDYREFRAMPVPPELPAGSSGDRLVAAMRRLPVGRTVVDEIERQRAAGRYRGLSVADAWRRLDRATVMFNAFADRLGPHAEQAIADAVIAEGQLRELTERTAMIERTLRLGPAAGEHLRPLHETMHKQLMEGVAGYEQFVAAAAGCVAQDGSAVTGLTEATDFLKGVADALRDFQPNPKTA